MPFKQTEAINNIPISLTLVGNLYASCNSVTYTSDCLEKEAAHHLFGLLLKGEESFHLGAKAKALALVRAWRGICSSYHSGYYYYHYHLLILS